MKNMRSLILLSVLVFSTWTGPANATILEYDMFWQGDAGYTVVGMFSFDDAVVGSEADETELLSFMATAFESDGDPLKTYDLTNQDELFNFHFDLASQSILQSGFTTSSTGFLIGKGMMPVAPDDWFFGGGTTGCAPENPGIVLSEQGGCESQVLDGLGTDLTASLRAPIPEPEIYAMLGIGLGLMGWVGRRKKLQAA
jgi:hypothetical protein